MSLHTFNFNSTYSVQIVSAVWLDMAYSIPCMVSFLSHSRHKKIKLQATSRSPTNLTQNKPLPAAYLSYFLNFSS